MTRPGSDREADTAVERGVPCICPRQFEANPPVGLPVASSDSRELTVERVRCTGCARTWNRVNS